VRSWRVAVQLDPAAGLPLFLQIARSISNDVRRGRLRAGDLLPSSRALASSLEVHRNTVLAAYRELAAEGWIATQTGRGTVVSGDLAESATPAAPAAAAGYPRRAGFDLRPAIDPGLPTPFAPGILVLSGGAPDLRLVPANSLARAYRRALRAEPGGRSPLDYGDPCGHPRLREALAVMLGAVRGLAAQPENVLITRGSQMALDVIGRALLSPGDLVAVESMGYRPAWGALRQAGAKLVPLPVDEHGLSVETLTELAARRPVKAVYLTPHHQYPTTALLSAGRRMALLELARARRILVIEDDYDHEFHYDGRPVLPLASADTAGVVVYVGTLSKILAPSLRLGFVVAPQPVIERCAAVRALIDRQGDQVVERAIAELIEDGEIQRLAGRARRTYLARRDALCEALSRRLGGALSFTRPAGGIALWAHAHGIDVRSWVHRAVNRQKVGFRIGRDFTFDGRDEPYVRLGFASLNETEIAEAVVRMAAALPS
jgi:GntR family transcriptional regulator / MocR family aminotransferase